MLDVLAYYACIAFFCNLEVSKNTLENEGKYPGKVYRLIYKSFRR